MRLKENELVFYASNGRVILGRLVRRCDTEKWIIVPVYGGGAIAKRKADKVFPATLFKKHLTFS